MKRHIKLFEEFVNESTTDGTIENLIDATKIAMNMGVFDDNLLRDIKADFISGIKGSLKTETNKVPQDKRKEFQKFMDSLIMPLDRAKTMSQFLSALKIIATTKNNIIKRLSIQESLAEGKITDFLKDLKSKGADWLETNKKRFVDSIVSTLISWITGFSKDVSKSLSSVNESSLNENKGRDEAQKIIQRLRSKVFKSLSDDELDEFKKEMALALDL